MRALKTPRYEVLPDEDERRYRITEQFSFMTPITGRYTSIANVLLTPDGTLFVFPGYRYDLGTYALDTPAMVVASLGHDALIDLMDFGDLDPKWRAEADRFFHSLLHQYSDGPVERSWSWVRLAGVRLWSTARRIFSW